MLQLTKEVLQQETTEEDRLISLSTTYFQVAGLQDHATSPTELFTGIIKLLFNCIGYLLYLLKTQRHKIKQITQILHEFGIPIILIVDVTNFLECYK